MNRLVKASLVVLAAVCSASCDPGEPTTGEAVVTDDHEASMNFDFSGLEPFLLQVADGLDGLSRADVTALIAGVRELDVEAEREWVFDVRHEGAPAKLRVRVFMDDLDAPDLYFFTSAELAAELQERLIAFAEEQGW